MASHAAPPEGLPYKVAVLCDLRDREGRVLLIRRAKAPNMGLCSPIGGKLDMHVGESPAQCARREILEEAGIDLPPERIRLGGMIAETAFEGAGHWLLFWYRVTGAVEVTPRLIREGALEWHAERDLDTLPLPETDRLVIWPLVRRHVREDGGFFAAHIDCRGGSLRWTLEQAGG